MKKLLSFALALVAMSSCSNEQIDPNTPAEVKMNAQIATTKAAINPGSAVTDVQIARLDGTPDWTSVSSIITTGAIATDGEITLSPKQFYPTTGNVNFVGFYPTATTIAGGVASMTITGKEDVLYAQPVSGSKATAGTSISMEFNHMLTQFQFIIKKATDVVKDVQNVSVKFKSVSTTFNMALTDGALSGWKTDAEIEIMNNQTASEIDYTHNETYMIQPDLTSIVLVVSAEGYEEQEVTINGTNDGVFKKGHAYAITLTFKATEVKPTSTIAKWETGNPGNSDVE